jgi:hypothetical protein
MNILFGMSNSAIRHIAKHYIYYTASSEKTKEKILELL